MKDRLFWVSWWVSLLFILAFWGVIGFVAWHFVSKFW
jgi:hypothetical protein